VDNDIEKVLIDEAVILRRLDVLAQKVIADFAEEQESRELLVVGILTGALVFMADLLRRVPMPLQIETLSVASYHGGTESSGVVKFLDAKLPEVDGRRVLLIDDILDTGRTLKAVKEKLLQMGAASVRTAVLLSKEKERAEEVEADYVGFEMGDEFVVGYGLDYEGRYRNLPFVGVLKPEVYRHE
jgi:hypoxanthine phosphoribosyltransferase